MGSASEMGPGYFPTMLSAVLVVLGGMSIVRSFLVAGKPVGRMAYKAGALVTAGTFAFAFLLPRAGLIGALLALCLIAAAASVKFCFDWRAVAALIVLIAFCALVFVNGLGLPMPLLGSWIAG